MHYKLCAYWKARKEPIDACAERLSQFLSALSACDAAFTSWFEKTTSRRKAKQKEIDFKNITFLVDFLEKGRQRRDIRGEVMDELGFHVGMWNGAKSSKMVGLNITCGLYSTVPGIGGNCVIMNLPEELGDLIQASHMATVLAATATSWDPDWAGVMSLEGMSNRNFAADAPFVDWMLYLSNRLAHNLNVPKPSLIQQIDSIGWLIIVQQEPTEADNPVHLERIKSVQSVIGIK
ncbi:MAG: Imm52 family immunity protein [Gemmataceae bacterium]